MKKILRFWHIVETALYVWNELNKYNDSKLLLSQEDCNNENWYWYENLVSVNRNVSIDSFAVLFCSILFSFLFSLFKAWRHQYICFIFTFWSSSHCFFISEIPIFPLINLIQIVAFQGQIRCSLQILSACDVVLCYNCQLLRKWLFVLFLDNDNRLTMRMIIRVICMMICSLNW
jgi:hypothetical protein